MTVQGFIDFEQTKAALDFAVVLEHYNLQPIGTGDQLKISCPFHEPDKNPSCGVNLQKKAFQCFACHTKGNALAFVALMQDLNPDDMKDLKTAAVYALAEIMGLDPNEYRKAPGSRERPQNGSGASKRVQQGKRAASTSPDVSERRTASQTTPSDSDPVTLRRNDPIDLDLTLDPDHHFFSDRGISQRAVETFAIGYCNRGMMSGRIAIPIHNASGELVAYAGRWAEPELPEKTERYKLPKNFHKSLELYNLHRAKAIGGRHLVVVEGYWSTMRLHLLGIPCVASFGSSVSTEQAQLIRQSGFQFVTLIYDGDRGGRLGIDQALPILGRQVYARALELPDGMKPSSMPEGMLDAVRPGRKS